MSKHGLTHCIDCGKYIGEERSGGCVRCNDCARKVKNLATKEWMHRSGRAQPYTKNISCSSYLGVHIAEDVLSKVFKNVERQTLNNPGYDFICGRGYKIDVKSACKYTKGKESDRWIFSIKNNHVPDYFLLIAFDNREELNPCELWLIPSLILSDHRTVSISTTRLSKWDMYSLDTLNTVQKCCNEIRGE